MKKRRFITEEDEFVVTATNAKGLVPTEEEYVPMAELKAQRDALIKEYLMSLSPIQRLFCAARVNPKNPFNRHQAAGGTGRHIVARKERAYHKRRKAALRETPR